MQIQKKTKKQKTYNPLPTQQKKTRFFFNIKTSLMCNN